MENDYHNPYDHRAALANASLDRGGDRESDQLNHYEAPSCLVRNPSGSLFIPSSDPLGQTTLDSRLRYDAYSPHRQVGTHHIRGEHSQSNGSPGRSPNGESFKHLDRATLPSYASQAPGLTSRLGTSSGSGASSGTPTGTGLTGSNGSHAVPNLQSMRRSSPNSSSQYSQWRVQKDLGRRCSWKFVAIFFVLLSVILVSALIYTTASNFLKMSYDNAKACAVVETTDVGQNLILDSSSSNKHIQETSPSSNMPGHLNRQRASLPPDGTTFSHLNLGELQKKTMPSYSYWNFQFHQKESSYVEMDFLIPRGSSVGLYARKNAIPTLTLNDIRDVLSGFRQATAKRESRSIPTVTRTVNYYLEQGHWFLSLYNDDMDSQEVSFVVKVSDELTRNCPNGCHGRGECVLGRCQCEAGYDGPDCGQSMCPVLCSGHGDYEDGQCRCFPGWKGLECQLRHDQCEVADCSGHGQCVNGKCVCARGFTGHACHQADCPDPLCSGHGFCVEGSCVCRQGWRGATCSILDHEARQCLPDCSGHGDFDLESQKCICRGQWTGNDCSKERCNLECGIHGACESGRCVCETGWHGDVCSVRMCDPRCTAHGMCSNGTCLCTNGWNGKHCTLEGCPNNCNGHGQCKTNHALEWECWCDSGWFGQGCDIHLEQDCSDRVDNDQDGLTDCEDPECCESPVCRKSQLCHTVTDPFEILLRKHTPSATASFFERMKFIIEDKGLQSYVQKAGFNESRAAVVRGQVVTESGMGLIGVRVSTTLPNEGFTMTRDDGWFDLMVNGGGPVMLQFGRNPYPPLRLNIYVPWNEVVVLDPVKLSRSSDTGVLIPDILAPRKPCKDHDFDQMKPLVLATWKHGFQGQMPEQSAILVESQAVQESLALADSGIQLVYHSARAKGYLSTIQLQLTPDEIPSSLLKVHIRITIEGVVHEKVFEADPNIRYTYSWDGLNVYRQRVYGITTATVRVGYEYVDCGNGKDGLVWHIETTKLSGHDLASTDMGGWNLHVQHKYNFHSGILQKGDGNTIYLKYKPQVVTTVMGTGEARELSCTHLSCSNGIASKLKLLAPKALTSAPDGALYVADYNLIRKVNPDFTVTSLLKLNSSRVSYRYHLAHCTFSHELEQRQTVYVSQPELHQIIRLKKVTDVHDSELDSNWQPFIGNGERCLPGDSDDCGDGGKASMARLSYPKGIAIGVDGKVYFADGTNIRQVDESGIITTLIGHQHHRSTWKPMPCEGALPSSEVQLNWPTELAVSPLDGSLHFIDDNVVLKLTSDGRLTVVAGRPLHCPPTRRNSDLATAATLAEPQSIAFAPNGDLYVAESDSQRINRVRVVTTNGKISLVAGRESKCNCLDAKCSCYDSDHFLAANVLFSAISSLAVTPDSVLYVADQGNYRVRALSSGLPPEQADGVFEIPDPDAQETYIFNKFGQHVITKDLMTGSLRYSMAYTQTTSTGKLSSVTNAYGRKLTVLRDYKGRVNALQTATGLKYVLAMSRVGDLESLASQNPPFSAAFRYHRSTGLLKSKLESEKSQLYEYDGYGRLVRAVMPTGEVVGLTFNLTSQGAAIDVSKNGRLRDVVLVQENVVSRRSAEASKRRYVVSVAADKTLTCRDPWGSAVTLATIPHPVISLLEDPVMADSFPMAGEQRTYLGTNLVGELAWHYSLSTNGNAPSRQVMMGIKKTMKVNGDNLLTVFYDKLQRRQLLYAESGAVSKVELLEVRYDSLSRPISWDPRASFSSLRQSYDRFGNLQQWSWGEIGERFGYDEAGRLKEVSRGNLTVMNYLYSDALSTLPTTVTTGLGGKFILDYSPEDGGLSRIQTPRGHFHSFVSRSAVEMRRIQYQAPWIEDVNSFYELMYDSEGRVVRKRMPSPGREHVSFVYDDSGQLRKIMVGETESELGYDDDTGLLESVVTRIGHHFDMRTRNKYHGGLLKEQKVRFSGSSSPDFNNAVFRYQYDGNGRPAVLVSTVGSDIEEQRTDTSTYNSNTGQLESISGLRINRLGYNKTLLTDVDNNYYKSLELDSNGRPANVVYGLRRKEMMSMRLSYDGQGRLNKKSLRNHEGRPSEENFSYAPDGQLLKVWGPENFDFGHDENGNLVKVNSAQGEMTLHYDKGDRVERLSSPTKDVRVTYDPVTGCVGQIGANSKVNRRFWHDARGKLVQMVSVTLGGKATRVAYNYDHLGRLAAWIETRSNARQVTQFFYADVRHPTRVTHVHNPKLGLTQRLQYDEQGHLIAVDMSDQKLLVATDQAGSPILVFRHDGTVLKEILYSPFGEVIKDTSPNMPIPIGFRGGLSSTHAPTMYHMTNGRTYDAEIGQYLNPDWESLLQTNLVDPSQLFVYRFNNNDPINTHHSLIRHQVVSSMKYWATLFGYDIDKMLDVGGDDWSARSVPKEVVLPSHQSLRLVSGLESAVQNAKASLKELSFVPSLPADKERLVLNAKLTSKSSGFGSGFLLSVANSHGLSIANVIDGAPGVVQNIFASLLNGTKYLEDISYMASGQKSVFYFSKRSGTSSDIAAATLTSDMDNVNRLAGQFSVNVRALEQQRGKDLVIDNDQLELHVLYADAGSVAKFRDTIVQAIASRSIGQAWMREKVLVQSGFTGYGDWTKSQQNELVAMRPPVSENPISGVRGYEAVEIQPHARYPQLIRDQSNYGFVSEIMQQRRRKNRHGKTRKYSQ